MERFQDSLETDRISVGLLILNHYADSSGVPALVKRWAGHILRALPDGGFIEFGGAFYHSRTVGAELILTRNGFPVDDTSNTALVTAFFADLQDGLFEEVKNRFLSLPPEVEEGMRNGTYPPW